MRTCLVLVLAGALAAGCSGESPSSDDSAAAKQRKPTKKAASAKPRSQDERDQGRDLAWLKRLHRWEMNLRQDGMTVASAGQSVDSGARGRRVLRKPLRELAKCERRLLGQVGEPDAPRYRPGYDLLMKGCQRTKVIALKLIQAIDDGDPLPLSSLRDESEESTMYFRRGNRTLEHSLRANRRLPVTSGSRKESKIEPRLSRYTSRLVVHKPTGIEVRCWSTREWKFVKNEWGAYVGRGDLAGFVHSLEPRTSIAPVVCRPLARMIYRRERPTAGLPLYRTAEAVGILAHEAEHIRNNLDKSEATTECHAMQHMRRLARIMGASKSYADLLASTYWTELYPLNPPEYRAAGCRNGGPLDLRPASDVWP